MAVTPPVETQKKMKSMFALCVETYATLDKRSTSCEDRKLRRQCTASVIKTLVSVLFLAKTRERQIQRGQDGPHGPIVVVGMLKKGDGPLRHWSWIHSWLQMNLQR